MFKTAKFNRISENIVQQIRQAILEGRLKPGDRLPAEKDLAEDFGVSKASLREAFRALEALGLLEVRQGVSGGAFVREVDARKARDCLTNYLFFRNPSIGELSRFDASLNPSSAKSRPKSPPMKRSTSWRKIFGT
jgi:GntR family transcriptional repressor for pyruvate dehydrogenase complex